MATYIKGNIQFTPVVEQINRKFCILSKKCTKPEKIGPVTTESNSFMGAGTRTTDRGIIGQVRKNFLFFRENARGSVVTASEIQKRTLFAQASAGASHILKDLMQVSKVQQLWARASKDATYTINGVSANGYTYRGWVMAVQYAGGKNAAEGGTSYDFNTFPGTGE